MKNKAKPETAGVLKALKKARIRSVMVTGDNLETACSVAHECGLVDQMVDIWSLTPRKGLQGDDWQVHFSRVTHNNDEGSYLGGSCGLAMASQSHHGEVLRGGCLLPSQSYVAVWTR